MTTEYQHYQPLIHTVADEIGLDPVLIAALIQTESNFKADAFTHDPQFFARTMKPSVKYGHLHPRRYGSRYGLMQLLWMEAVEDGLDPDSPPECLFVPEVNVPLGAARLRNCLDWAALRAVTSKEMILSGLAAYKSGRNSAQAPPNPKNIAYSLRVWQQMVELAKGLQGA